MDIVSLFFILTQLNYVFGTHCNKELNYYNNYGYGVDITCEELTDDSSQILEDITVSNEKVLIINNSNLTNVNASLFQNVQNLKFLFIKNSVFLFKGKLFANFQKLEHLNIENTNFGNVTNFFTNLDSLKELSLINCNLSGIENNSFPIFKELETLKLSKNQIRNLDNIPFCHVPAVKFLFLDNNKIEKIEKNFLLCYEIVQNSAMLLDTEEKQISYYNNVNNKKKIPLTMLESLDLSNNLLKQISPDFKWPSTLRTINLSNNKLKKIPKNFNLTNLESLNLENNFLESVDNFSGLNLKFLNLRKNAIYSIQLNKLPQIEEIDLSYNKLSVYLLLTNMPKLQKLLLNNNFLQFCPESLKSLNFLQFLELANNRMLNYCFDNMTNLKYLSLKNNSLEHVEHLIFDRLTSLEVLDVSQNFLKFLDFNFFLRLGNLLNLNISHNLIENMSYDLLKPLHNLQVLDISGNKLQNFQINIVSLMPSLKIINIKDNLLSCNSLSNIIVFLKSKNIDFTINENFELDRQNVYGIYCEEIAKRFKPESKFRLLSIIGIVLILVSSSCLLSFSFYKCLLFTKRRHYFTDEIELL